MTLDEQKQLNDYIIETMSIIAKSAVEKASVTMIEEGEILGVIDEAMGVYSVSYLDNTITASSAYPDVRYKEGDKVNILFTNNDMGKMKFILGSVDPSLAPFQGSSVGYYSLSGGSILDGLSDIIEMSSYKSTEISLNSLIGSNFNQIFNEYTKNYSKSFSLKILLKTLIPEEQRYGGGDFGIRISIPVILIGKNGNDSKVSYHTFELNTSNLSGNPFSFSEYTYNEIVFSLDEYEEFDPDRQVTMSAFCNGFNQDPTKENDIFIKEINLECVEEYEENNSGYELILSAVNGPFFSTGVSSYEKELRPVLRFNGKKTSIDAYDCYWFKENSSVINTNSEGYNKVGGIGWECLNDTYTDDSGEIILDKSKKTLEILQSEILKSCRYKCCLIVEGNVIYKVIKIENLDSKIKIDLTSDPEILYPNSGNVTCKCLAIYSNKPTDADLRFEWNRYDSEGNLIVNNSNVNISTIIPEEGYGSTYSLPVSTINKINRVDCSVYLITAAGEKTLIGTASKTLTIAEVDKLDFNLVLENGNVLYKYDAYGNSPLAPGYVGVPGSVPKGTPAINFKIFKKDGSEFTESEYGVCEILWQIPKDSLFSLAEDMIEESDDEYYYFKGKTLTYGIKSKYDALQAIGQITLKVTFQDVVLQVNPNIIFIKEGENGTNGSNYVARITHIVGTNNEEHSSYEYGEDGRKLKFVWKCSDSEGNGEWYYHNQEDNVLEIFNNRTHSFGVNIYQGSTILTQNEVEIEWQMFDSAITNPCFAIDKNTGVLSLRSSNYSSWKDAEAIFCNTVQAKIKVGNQGENKTEYIFAYYPIEITRLDFATQALYQDNNASLIPHLDGGFSEVTYTEDGKNPSYVMNKPFNCVSEATDDTNLKGYFEYNWESSNNFTISGGNNNKECSFIPISNFDNNISKNYIKVGVRAINGYSEEEKESIITEKENIITNNTNYVDDIDTIKNNLEEWIGDYNGNFDEKLNNSYEYLQALSKCISRLTMIKKDFLREVVPFLRNPDNHCINDDYVIDESFGIDYLERYYQSYIKYLCNFDLTEEYDEYDVERALIDKETIKNAEFEVNFSTHLTDFGLRYYNSKREEYAESIIPTYNAYVKDFLTFRSGEYVYRDKYIAFEEYYGMMENFLDDSEIISFENFVLRDNGNTEVQKLINNLKNDYKYITNLFKDYDIVIKPNPTEEEKIIALNSFNNYDSYYFYKNTREVAYIVLDYAYLHGDTGYVLQPSVSYILDSSKKKYEQIIDSTTKELNGLEQIFEADFAAIIHIKPLVMLVNRYGNSYLNDWDGNKLYIDEENGQYLFAPQVGAGVKQEGQFTGIIIGGRGSNGIDDTTDVGLFGYNNSNQTIFLDAKTGGATFGLSGGGQIIIDPNEGEPDNPKAIIKSGNYQEKDTEHRIVGSGMQIDLAEPSIKFGSENFSVNKKGQMVSQEGYIGGWEIGVNNTENSDRGQGASLLHSPFYTRTLSGLEIEDTDVSDVIYLDSNAKYNEKTGQFITADENLTSAIYTGNHKALDNDNKGFFLSSDGMSISSFFKVNSQGMYVGHVNDVDNRWTICYDESDLSKKRAYISFGTTELEISEFTEEKYNTTLSQYDEYEGLTEDSKVYLGTDGISLGGGEFWVTNKGVFKASKGYIGDWMLIKERLLGGLKHYNNHSEFTMEINSKKGYISHADSAIDTTTYGTPENELDVYNNNRSYILSENGLFFGGWNTYLDNVDSYIHSDYGDIGGFHFTGSTLETGKVPQAYKNKVYEYSYDSTTGNESWRAREIPNLKTIVDIRELREDFTPISSNDRFEDYMKISPVEQCITFNAIDENTPKLFRRGVYIGQEGIVLGDTFEVNYFGEITSTAGKIANWDISNNMISRVDSRTIEGVKYPCGIFIESGGTLQGGFFHYDEFGNKEFDGDSWSITEEGYASFNNVHITGGSLTIGTDLGGNYYAEIDDEGHIKCRGISIKDGKIELGVVTPAHPGTTTNSIQIGNKDTDSYFYASGTTLECQKLVMDGGTITMKDGAGNVAFKVTDSGKVSIYDGDIVIKDGDTIAFKLSTSGTTIMEVRDEGRNPTFTLSRSGRLVCTDATIGGVDFKDVSGERTVTFPANTTIEAPASNLGGWQINEASISRGSTTLSTSDLSTTTGHFSGRVDAGTLFTHGQTDIGGSAKFRSDATFDTTTIFSGGATFNSNTTFNGGTTTFKNIETDAISANQTVLCKNGLNVSGGTVIIGAQTLENYIKSIIDDYVTRTYITGKIGSSTYAAYNHNHDGVYASASHTHNVSVDQDLTATVLYGSTY